MPEYIHRNLDEVAFGLRCPFCSNDYKSKSGLLTHAKHCSENSDLDENLEDITVWEDTSASDMILWQDELTKLTKDLIKSHELELIQTQTPEQIREHIRKLMRNRTLINYTDVSDIYRIYEFFFGLTETDRANRIQELYDCVNKALTP